MNRPGPIVAWVAVPMLVVLAMTGPIPAQEQDRSDDPGATTLDPNYFDLIRRTLGEIRDDLEVADPDLAPEALRGRLLIEAQQLINNVTNSGLKPDQLLNLPGSLKDDASQLVAEVLGDRLPNPAPPTTTDPDPEPVEDVQPTPTTDRSVPVRLRPFEPILREILTTRFGLLRASDSANPAGALEREAISLAARAVSPSNDPRDLSADERSFAMALARQIAEGASGTTETPLESFDPRLQDDLDALTELLRRKNSEMKLTGERPGISERIEFLEQYGNTLLDEAARRRDLDGTIPDSARAQVRSMAELIARGVPIALRPESEEDEPITIDDSDELLDPPDEVPFELDPALLVSIDSLARAIDQGLIAAGVDLLRRREALQAFSRKQLARKTGRDPETFPPDVLNVLDQLIEQILSDHTFVVDPVPPTVIVTPPPVTPVPPIITVPPVARPVPEINPGALRRWCLPWK